MTRSEEDAQYWTIGCKQRDCIPVFLLPVVKEIVTTGKSLALTHVIERFSVLKLQEELETPLLLNTQLEEGNADAISLISFPETTFGPDMIVPTGTLKSYMSPKRSNHPASLSITTALDQMSPASMVDNPYVSPASRRSIPQQPASPMLEDNVDQSNIVNILDFDEDHEMDIEEGYSTMQMTDEMKQLQEQMTKELPACISATAQLQALLKKPDLKQILQPYMNKDLVYKPPDRKFVVQHLQ